MVRKGGSLCLFVLLKVNGWRLGRLLERMTCVDL